MAEDAARPRRSGVPEGYFDRPDVVARRAARAREREPLEAASLPTARTPRTPRTPVLGRLSSSTFSSPGAGFRTDDETIVFEFGTRFLRAGLAGEAHPRSHQAFGPEKQKRAGDYSRWLTRKKAPETSKETSFDNWGKQHELWQLDLRNVDVGLIADKCERGLREAFLNDLLILDNKHRRFILTLPSQFPQALLSMLMHTLFTLHPAPSTITLLPSSICCAVAAGLRSALVVDIGWHETTVTALCEYREVHQKRSSRGMKLLSWETKRLLEAEIERQHLRRPGDRDEPTLSFLDIEEVLMKMVWCKKMLDTQQHKPLEESDDIVTIPFKSSSSTPLNIAFSHLASPTEAAFFATSLPSKHYDDHETPLPFLIFTALLDLPIDVRQICLTRILTTGGGSHIPGIKSRLIAEVSHVIQMRGWDPVSNYGSIAPQKARTRCRPSGPTSASPLHHPPPITTTSTTISVTPAHLQSQIDDASILQSLQTHTLPRALPLGVTAGRSPHPPQSELRCVSTLGAWAGASLLAGLKIQGVVEIEREGFMKHGLAGAGRGRRGDEGIEVATEMPALIRRQTLGRRPTGGGGEKTDAGWTLGLWG